MSFAFNDEQKLTLPLAVKIVGDWYYSNFNYDYNAEPTTTDAGVF